MVPPAAPRGGAAARVLVLTFQLAFMLLLLLRNGAGQHLTLLADSANALGAMAGARTRAAAGSPEAAAPRDPSGGGGPASSPPALQPVMWALARRAGRTRCWAVALKALQVSMPPFLFLPLQLFLFLICLLFCRKKIYSTG